MNEVKSTVNARVMDDFKLTRKIASIELSASRGYSLNVDSTYHQSRILNHNDDFKLSMTEKLSKAAVSSSGEKSMKLPLIASKNIIK